MFRTPLAVFLLAATSATALAGSPGGLQLVVVHTSKAAPHQPHVQAFFDRHFAGNGIHDCDDSALTIDGVHYQSGSKGITGDLIKNAVFSSAQHKKALALMSSFRDNNHHCGFDGALVSDVIDNKLVFYGVSAHRESRKYTYAVPLNELANKKKMDYAI